jgi:NAD/NADP transhydrogenase beta subunit
MKQKQYRAAEDQGGGCRTAKNKVTEMGRQVAVVLYVVGMAAVIVAVDFLFFRHRFWERLTVNIGIALVFAAFYLRFLRHS